jgi:hypothetical protein
MNNDAQIKFLIKKMAEDHRPELPSPGVIWWRAHIQKKFAEKERIERPMVIMRQLAAVACAVVIFALVFAHWRVASAMVRQSGIGLYVALVTGVWIAVLVMSRLRPFKA